MRCPSCGSLESSVNDSRLTDSQTAIRRRRVCGSCGSRFTTFERVQTTNLYVLKRDNTLEAYDREKLLKGVLIACGKRPDILPIIHQKLGDLEEQWSKTGTVSSKQIGDDVLDMLKNTDDIGFIRFASVYKKFPNIHTFLEEMQKMIHTDDIKEPINSVIKPKTSSIKKLIE